MTKPQKQTVAVENFNWSDPDEIMTFRDHDHLAEYLKPGMLIKVMKARDGLGLRVIDHLKPYVPRSPDSGEALITIVGWKVILRQHWIGGDFKNGLDHASAIKEAHLSENNIDKLRWFYDSAKNRFIDVKYDPSI